MESISSPEELALFTDPATRGLRDVYDANAARFDGELGDDAMVFGVNIYRNSWFRMEQIVQDLDHWTSSRPDGSLVIAGAGFHIHVYRHGQDETVDLHSFRLDEGVSDTKRLIAAANAVQLTLDLEPTKSEPSEADVSQLRELVIIHAGNPDDGCCGIWIGAPIPADEIQLSPWRWIKPLWVIERSAVESQSTDQTERKRHDELPEPDIAVEPIDESQSEVDKE